MIFVDTSALYALLDRDDASHDTAVELWPGLRGHRLVTHGYVVVEVLALVQRRLGMRAVRTVVDAFLPLLEVRHPDAALLDRASTALLAHDSRQVSLVDWTSFELMRAERIRSAFAFDDDFAHQGFRLLSAP